MHVVYVTWGDIYDSFSDWKSFSIIFNSVKPQNNSQKGNRKNSISLVWNFLCVSIRCSPLNLEERIISNKNLPLSKVILIQIKKLKPFPLALLENFYLPANMHISTTTCRFPHCLGLELNR